MPSTRIRTMPFDVPSDRPDTRDVSSAAIAAICLGGVVLAGVIGVLLYAFVRVVAG